MTAKDSDRYRGAVAQLAVMVGVWQRILVTHVRDAEGYCAHPMCRRPGTGTGYAAFPCSTRVLALDARALHGKP
jgi:hypothetical protein